MSDVRPLLQERLVLSPDAVISPASEIDAQVRSRLDVAPDEYALTVVGERSGTQLINREAALFLKRFAAAATIQEAVAGYAELSGESTADILDQALDLVHRWKRRGVLRPAQADEAAPSPTLTSGARIGNYQVLEAVRCYRDAEVYRARTSTGEVCALKVGRPGLPAGETKLFAREAAILDRLQGCCCPRVLDRGIRDGRAFLCLEWCEGEEVTRAAHRWSSASREGRRGLLALCGAILRAYDRIHERGVIHGDVHPGNILVDASERVWILDFGLAQLEGSANSAPGLRGGIPYYFEPEYARSCLAGESAPAATRLGEQYALAALLYLLLSGHRYLDFGWERTTILQQIVAEPPRSFASLGELSWPQAERALCRALSKAPTQRFTSLAEFGQNLGARAPAPGGVKRDTLDDLIARLTDPRRVVLAPPRASVAYGAAGIAYLYYRAACVLDRPDLLSAAMRWVHRARRELRGEEGVLAPALDIGDGVATSGSLYYGRSGVHCVDALVSHARGDFYSLRKALAEFAAAIAEPQSELDLTRGKASALLACAILLQTLAPGGFCDLSPLVQRGTSLCGRMWAQLNQQPPIGEPGTPSVLGMAHGWAGMLYATLQWLQSGAASAPPEFERRLFELERMATRTARGICWPTRSLRGAAARGGWCHGSAGHVSLWAAACPVLRSERARDVALAAAEHMWANPTRNMGHLCCGLAGQAEALLDVYRLTCSGVWLERARELGRMISGRDFTPNSLLRGEVGVALLQLDLREPAASGMPLLGPQRP